MSVEELIQLRPADCDPTRTALAIRRGTRVFTVVLDPVVAGALVTWLRTRVSRHDGVHGHREAKGNPFGLSLLDSG